MAVAFLHGARRRADGRPWVEMVDGLGFVVCAGSLRSQGHFSTSLEAARSHAVLLVVDNQSVVMVVGFKLKYDLQVNFGILTVLALAASLVPVHAGHDFSTRRELKAAIFPYARCSEYNNKANPYELRVHTLPGSDSEHLDVMLHVTPREDTGVLGDDLSAAQDGCQQALGDSLHKIGISMGR
eukprot:gene24587-10201_t